jgi:hypothetical protein
MAQKITYPPYILVLVIFPDGRKVPEVMARISGGNFPGVI